MNDLTYIFRSFKGRCHGINFRRNCHTLPSFSTLAFYNGLVNRYDDLIKLSGIEIW